jgi:RES domain-containing protein
MLVAWRISKVRYPAYDGTGARIAGARWNSPGQAVIYSADSFAGAILEILAHSLRPRTLAGEHHAVRIEIPDSVAETLDPAAMPGWDTPDAPEARDFGDRWLQERRSAVLVVPAVTSRPIGRNLLINPDHPDAGAIEVSEAFPVLWDERLF